MVAGMYPDNTRDGALTEGACRSPKPMTDFRIKPQKSPPAPTTAKTHDDDVVVDILDYITKVKGVFLSNSQLIRIIEILHEEHDM